MSEQRIAELEMKVLLLERLVAQLSMDQPASAFDGERPHVWGRTRTGGIPASGANATLVDGYYWVPGMGMMANNETYRFVDVHGWNVASEDVFVTGLVIGQDDTDSLVYGMIAAGC